MQSHELSHLAHLISGPEHDKARHVLSRLEVRRSQARKAFNEKLAEAPPELAALLKAMDEVHQSDVEYLAGLLTHLVPHSPDPLV